MEAFKVYIIKNFILISLSIVLYINSILRCVPVQVNQVSACRHDRQECQYQGTDVKQQLFHLS